MILPKTKQQLEEFGRSPSGRELFEHFEEEITRLNKVENLATWEDTIGHQREIAAIRRFMALFKPNPQGVKDKTIYT